MKKIQIIMATTRVDLHGDKMTLEALNSIVHTIQQSYIPMGLNHNIRYPPGGRVVSAEVIKLPDGEYAVQGTAELFEPSDTMESLAGDGRKIRIHQENVQTFSVEYDRSFLDEEGKGLIQELSGLSGKKPEFIVKKALEPISILIIAGGIFVFGSIAQGFFTKLGEDLYSKLKDTLRKYYKKETRPDQLLDFRFSTEKNGKVIEVNILINNPNEEVLNDFFSSELGGIDEILIKFPTGMENEVAKIVLQFENKELSVRYAVRDDSVPLTFKAKVKKERRIARLSAR